MSEIYPDWTVTELDEHLGRWRWPEHPQFTVVENPESLWVTNEESVTVRSVPKNVALQDEGSGPTSYQAAHAFLEAHPPRPKWHDAQPGEIWAIRTDTQYPCFDAHLVCDNGFSAICDLHGGLVGTLPVNSPAILSAHRIWSGDGLAD